MSEKKELNPINRRVMGYRRMAGYTQADVAKMLNMNRNSYAHKERYGKLSIDFIQTLARIFNVPYIKILEDENTTSPQPVPNNEPIYVKRPDSPPPGTAEYVAMLYSSMSNEYKGKALDYMHQLMKEFKMNNPNNL